MARNKKVKKSSGGNQEWLLTYSDLVTLLFAFFVLLYAFSKVDEVKFQQVKNALNKVLNGAGPSIVEMAPDPNEDDIIIDEPDVMEPTNMADKIGNDLIGYIQESDLEDYIEVQVTEAYVSINIKDVIIFDSGKAELKTESKEVLKKIGGILNKVKNRVLIEGHTDNVPMSSPEYPSNWELSIDRSYQVAMYLIHSGGMKESRLGVAGFSEYRPIDKNDTPEGRANNRRVSIVVYFD